MILESFRITDYRSINDSGNILASNITALLGRNESGKSNLLRALHSLKPAEGFAPLNRTKDFPRHRHLDDCNDDTVVVTSRWILNQQEQADLAKIWPRAREASHVEIGRCYGAKYWVCFHTVAPILFDKDAIAKKIGKIASLIRSKASKLEESQVAQIEKAMVTFESATSDRSNHTAWSKAAVPAFTTLHQAMKTAAISLSDTNGEVITTLEKLAKSIAGDEDAHTKARDWATKKMPIFIYLDEYPSLSGHQNISELFHRRQQGTLTDADRSFEKMCKVSGLKPEELHSLLQKNDHETRNQLANRASAVVTQQIRVLWKDRLLKIRFNPDADHLDTFVSDPNAVFDVEVNLDERSRGFKWFFSFYIVFAADTKGGDAANAILLLDEPGLYLHAKSQSDLLEHFRNDFPNQIIYTTHSPFMVPVQHLDSVRTVNIAESAGTTVTNDPTGDAKTLFPLQAALGYDIAQSLFVGPNNLVVEGVTDFWALSAISEYLAGNGAKGLHPDLTITPAGGAQKISYMVALLTSERLNVLVLLDEESKARDAKDSLVKDRLIREQNVVFVTEAFDKCKPKEADMEDLLGPRVYEDLVRESYSKELEGTTLVLLTSS